MPRDVVVQIPRANLQTVRLDSVEPQPIRWLWEPRFALGKVSLLSGDPGRGKSLVTIAMAAAVSRGFDWPVDGTKAPRGSVLMLSGEDDIADTIRPRLDAAGADVARIHCATFVNDTDRSRRTFSLQTDVELLASTLETIADCKLVVVDPISAFTGAVDTHKNSDVRVLLASLSEIAQRHDVAILAVSHLNKGSSTAMYRTMGSLAFTAAARAVYAVADDPHDPQRRLVLPIKNNLGGDLEGLAYKVDVAGNGAPTITWESAGVVDGIDAVLSADRDKSSELSQAMEWLNSELSGGPVDTKDLQKLASDAGHAWRTVRRAQEKLGVKSRKTGRAGAAWQWWHPHDLPDGTAPSRR